MSTRLFAIALTVAWGVGAAGVSWSAPEPPGPAAVSDEVILKFEETSDARARDAVLAALGATQTSPLGRAGALLVRLAAPTAARAIAAHVTDPSLDYIEPNFVYEAALVPNEAAFAQQWALLNTGQTGGTPGADIRATAAWDLATGSPSVVIGLLDSGIDFAHPDLAGSIYVNPGEVPGNGLDDDANGFVDDVHGWDFVSEDNDPQDDNGHGTLGAGIAGAVGNNGVGIAGVCWHVSLLPIKFLDDRGSGTTANAVRALDYAITMGAPITNNSWGGGGFSQALLDEIVAADQAGIAFVASAGAEQVNLDVSPVYPASYGAANVIAVAATDHNDQLATFSNWGPETVDLAAPGAGILTTSLGSSYFTMSGTSAAAAHVSGALALVVARFPTISGTSAATHLLAHAEHLPSLTGLVHKESRLDAYAPLGEMPTDVSVDEASAATRPRLWWRGTNRDGVRLGLYLPRGEHGEGAELAVFDVRGRRIRTLLAPSRAPGFQEIAWDGRDDRGGRTAKGVYVVRLRGSSGAAATRVVVQR